MKTITTLDQIRAQAEPNIIEIPGFRPGATISVAVRMVDLTPHILETGIGNPLVAVAAKKAREGKSKAQIEKEMEQMEQESSGQGMDMQALLPALEAIVQEALVEPTYEEIVTIRPMTLDQKMAIFTYATGDARELISFRGE